MRLRSEGPANLSSTEPQSGNEHRVVTPDGDDLVRCVAKSRRSKSGVAQMESNLR